MARIVTKELALKIAKKFGAVIERSSGAHDLACVYHDGVLVATFGIRRGSEKDQGHDHIPAEIYVSKGWAKAFGQCKNSLEEWINIAREKGKISTPSDTEQSSEQAT